MPSHLIHFYVDRVLFQKIYYRVHRDIDSAYPYFRGKHRLFWHDPVSAIAIAANDYPGDENAVSAALVHLEVDNMCSADPLFHQQLLLLAREDAKRRKKAKKHKTKPQNRKSNKKLSELEKTEKVFKQLLELKRIVRLIRS